MHILKTEFVKELINQLSSCPNNVFYIALRFNGGNQNKGTPFPIILEIGIVCYSE
jgi:hypothetical protein